MRNPGKSIFSDPLKLLERIEGAAAAETAYKSAVEAIMMIEAAKAEKESVIARMVSKSGKPADLAIFDEFESMVDEARANPAPAAKPKKVKRPEEFGQWS